MNFLYKIYFSLPNLRYPVLLHKMVNRIYLFIFKKLFNQLFEKEVEKMRLNGLIGTNQIIRDYRIEVSLTSFPARINEVHKTIETIFSQTIQADSITLWLSIEQFPNQIIPKQLEEQKKRGLIIEFVPDDLRSHKKYYYAFQRQKNNLVITFDDDVFYPSNTIESLINAHRLFPEAVICNRGHKITFNSSKINKYKKWNHNFNSKIPLLASVATGVGGVLYPPNSYVKDIFRIDVFKNNCFYADDLWLKLNTIKNNTKTLSLRTFKRDFINVGQSQKNKLVQQNSLEGGNDKQLLNILNHYKIQASIFKD